MRSARMDGQSPGSSGNGTEAELPDLESESGAGAAHAVSVRVRRQSPQTRRADSLEDVGRGDFMDWEPSIVRNVHGPDHSGGADSQDGR